MFNAVVKNLQLKPSVIFASMFIINNQNYNKILECDCLSVALIIALIGQFTRHAWCYWLVYASCLVLLDSIRVICARCYIDYLVHFLLQKMSSVTFSFMKTFN